MKKVTPEMRLERVLERLSREIALSTDTEVLEACADLRIQPEMKGSVAFVGVKGIVFPYRPWVLPASGAATLTDPDNDPPDPDDDPPDLAPRRQ
jgi:hypothetical protein